MVDSQVVHDNRDGCSVPGVRKVFVPIYIEVLLCRLSEKVRRTVRYGIFSGLPLHQAHDALANQGLDGDGASGHEQASAKHK